ncbi:MAG: type VI secretion protein, partial [Erysipelotrichaceae bacterium]|nr:type VI secretion protein [Erysipelotrichaceae bacterium]
MNTEKIILANNCIYESDPKITGVNRNILAVGGTGSGKTYSIVIPQLLEVIRNKAPGVKIFICTKRTVPDLFIPILISMKYKVYDLNFT